MTTSSKQVIFISSCEGFTGSVIANHVANEAKEYGDIESIYLGCTDTKEAHELLNVEHLGTKKVRLCELDLKDKSRIDECLKNVTTLCLVPPTRSDKLEVAKMFIDCAERAGVQRCVLISWAGCDIQTGGSQMKKFMQAEQHLNASKIPIKMIARPTFYVQNLFLYANEIVHQGKLPAPTGSGKWSSVDLDQFGKAMARMVSCPKTMDKCKGQVLTFTGAESLDGETMARQLSESLNKEIQFRDISRGEAEKLIRGASTSLDDSEVQALLESYDLIRDGKMDFVTNDAQKVLGEEFKPLRFKEVIERDMDQLKSYAKA